MLLTARIGREGKERKPEKKEPGPSIPEVTDPELRYTDEEEIGEGGTAIVYKAYDT